MTHRFAAAVAWLRGFAWQEYLGLTLLALAGGATVLFAERLSSGPRFVLGALCLLTLVVMLRRGWVTLLGPVALYELVRTTRRSRFVLHRLYAYFILIVLSLCFSVWAAVTTTESGSMKIPAQEMARFAASFVFTFLGLQMLLLAVLTPAYTAGVLAEEKDRGTLEFLLATDLRNREIVLSKLAARLGILLLTVLTGLPILGFLQFLGGVDPLLVLAAFAATAAMMVGLASLGVLNSVYCRRPHTAIVLTLLEGAAYLVFSYTLPQMVIGTGLVATAIPGLGGFTVADALAWFDAGNPVTLLFDLARDAMSGTLVAVSLAGRLGEYVVFHGVLALVCIAWASARLRAVFRKQMYEQSPALGRRRRPGKHRSVGRWPMVWKEVVAERGLRFRWFGRTVVAVLVIGSFLPVVVEVWGAGPRLSSFIAGWTRAMGSTVACLLLVGVAVRAATALNSERERQTLDCLLTTPMGAGEILFGKWLGSVACVRGGWLWLGAIWGFGVAAGQLHGAALALMLAAWWIYAAVLAVIGLWFSLSVQSSVRATALTVVMAFGLGFSYLFTLPLIMLSPSWPDPGWLLTQFNRFQAGLSPLLTLGWLLAFGQDGRTHGEGWELPMALAGLASWLVGGAVLWCLLLRRFRERSARQAVRRPERDSAETDLLAGQVAIATR